MRMEQKIFIQSMERIFNKKLARGICGLDC